MPRLRPKQPKQQTQPVEPAMAICVEGYRALQLGVLFERGDAARFPIRQSRLTRSSGADSLLSNTRR